MILAFGAERKSAREGTALKFKGVGFHSARNIPVLTQKTLSFFFQRRVCQFWGTRLFPCEQINWKVRPVVAPILTLIIG